jgi:hypothetical protein
MISSRSKERLSFVIQTRSDQTFSLDVGTGVNPSFVRREYETEFSRMEENREYEIADGTVIKVIVGFLLGFGPPSRFQPVSSPFPIHFLHKV